MKYYNTIRLGIVQQAGHGTEIRDCPEKKRADDHPRCGERSTVDAPLNQ